MDEPKMTAHKALVAFVVALLALLNTFFGITVEFLSPDVINAIALAIVPILVYLFPNKPTA
jgi:LytS/YehU family sensor histidine kinase